MSATFIAWIFPWPRGCKKGSIRSCVQYVANSFVARACMLSLIGIIVIYSQIKNRPNHVAVYYTNDPNDNKRGGVLHTCGCELPSTVQRDPQIPKNSTKSGQLNVCYDRSSLEDEVHVLMYNANSSAAEVVEPMIRIASLENQTVHRPVRGYSVTQQAHELKGPTLADLDVEFPNLYLNGYKPHDALRTVPYLQSDNFTSFPTSFLRLGFIYVCNDCSMTKNCSLSSVNDLLKDVAQGETWGNCYEWGGPSCTYANITGSTRYLAKCTLFPPRALPLNFAVQRFLGEFFNLKHIGSIYSIPDPHDEPDGILNTTSNSVSFQASVPYVNFSQVVTQNITLGFAVVQKSSALWFSLLENFPTVENDCSSLHTVDVCNGTSFCNVFTTGVNSYAPAVVIRNNDTYMENSTSCKARLANDTFDNADSVVTTFDIDTWTEGLCIQHKCSKPAPYLVTWNMSQDPLILNNSLNQFLYSSVLKNFWAQRSGVCMNNYYGVFQYSPLSSDNVKTSSEDILGKTMFLEAQCTNQSNIYCWLTGNYNYLNDLPHPTGREFGRKLHGDEFSGPTNRFVCFRYTKQPFWIWIASSLGILFGWLGSGVLVFQFFEWLSRKNQNQDHDQEHESGPPGPPTRTARTAQINRATRTARTAQINRATRSVRRVRVAWRAKTAKAARTLHLLQ